MKKYTVEIVNDGRETKYSMINKNAKQESMDIYVRKITCDLSDKKHLMWDWYKMGLIAKPMESYVSIDVYVEDSEGGCKRDYDPTIHPHTTRINFEWMLEYTPENVEKLVNECVRRFESATGKSATEIKIEKIHKFAEEHNMEIVTEIPEGYKKVYWCSCPSGAYVAWNRKSPIKKLSKYCLVI